MIKIENTIVTKPINNTARDDSLFNCNFCHKLLHVPVQLPCGETICRVHSIEITEKSCQFCLETFRNTIHQIPEEGFPVNKFARKQLASHLNTLNINFEQFNKTKDLIQDLSKDLRDIELIRNEPKKYISDYFNDVNHQIECKRDSLIKEIEKYSNEMVQKVNILKSECFVNLSKNTKVNKRIDECKVKLEELKSMFELVERHDRTCEEIMSLKRIKDLKNMMKPLEKVYKCQLLGNKSYKLTTKEIDVNEVFGTLNSTDEEVMVRMFIFNEFYLGEIISVKP